MEVLLPHVHGPAEDQQRIVVLERRDGRAGIEFHCIPRDTVMSPEFTEDSGVLDLDVLKDQHPHQACSCNTRSLPCGEQRLQLGLHAVHARALADVALVSRIEDIHVGPDSDRASASAPCARERYPEERSTVVSATARAGRIRCRARPCRPPRDLEPRPRADGSGPTPVPIRSPILAIVRIAAVHRPVGCRREHAQADRRVGGRVGMREGNQRMAVGLRALRCQLDLAARRGKRQSTRTGSEARSRERPCRARRATSNPPSIPACASISAMISASD